MGKTQNIIDRPVIRLYLLETSFQFVLKVDKQDSAKKMKETFDQTEMLQTYPNFESSMPRISIEEGAVENTSDTYSKLLINHMPL